MIRWFRGVQATLGRTATAIAGAAVAIGIVAFASGLGESDRPRTYAALIASWLFFASLAAGVLAFRAFFQIVSARWARPLTELAGAAVGFAPVALVLLFVIVIGARSAPWLHTDPGSTWMSVSVLSIRELVLTAALFGGGYLLRKRPASGALAVIYLVAYGVIVSFWAFDFVLGTDAVWESTLIGVFVFVSAFVGGVGLVTLLGMARGGLADGPRRDASKLVLALSIFWAYLFWAQYLTIWYGNLPDEVAFALRRVGGGWSVVMLLVIGLVFALPFVTLLHPVGRRSRRLFGGLLVLQLVGLWLVCHLLIVPSLTPRDAAALDLRDVLVALGILGAFALSVARGIAATPLLASAPIPAPQAQLLDQPRKTS
ncbi:MAG: hypothetical protein ABI591_04030 [Kofleriaceae bacterium]